MDCSILSWRINLKDLTGILHAGVGRLLIWVAQNIKRRLEKIELLADGSPAHEADLLSIVNDWCIGITRYNITISILRF